MAKTLISLVLRLLVAAVFGYAGVVKIWDFAHGGSATQDFFQDVLNYQLVSWDVAMGIALYLPWLEVFTAAAVLTRRWRFGGLLVAAGLTLLFLGALGSAWARGLDVSCGCFGKEENATDFPVALTRDALLLAAIGVAYRIEAQRPVTRSLDETTASMEEGPS